MKKNDIVILEPAGEVSTPNPAGYEAGYRERSETI